MIDPAEAVRRLHAIDHHDPEVARMDADRVLLELVPDEVRRAHEDLVRRCAWWASS